jgi:hypothetical protein
MDISHEKACVLPEKPVFYVSADFFHKTFFSNPDDHYRNYRSNM